jgi:Tfp pilus assembly protein PilX
MTCHPKPCRHRPLAGSAAEANPLGRDRQRGSAFIITLMVLVVLTILGLSLAFVTSGEQQVGANERLISRVFYAADSGIAIATARLLVNNDPRAATFKLPADGGVASAQLRNEVELQPVIPLYDLRCDLCASANGTGYNQRLLSKASNAIRVQGRRVVGVSETIIGRKNIEVMLEVTPQEVTTDAYKPAEKVRQSSLIVP